MTVKSTIAPARSVAGVPEHDSPGELPGEMGVGDVVVFEASLALAADDQEGTEWKDQVSDPPSEGNILVADTSFGEQSWGDESEVNVPAADRLFRDPVFPSYPAWTGNILAPDSSFDSDPEDVGAFMDGVVDAVTNAVAQECGLDTLRVHNVDSLDLTQDTERLPSPQVSERTLRQANAIQEEDQAYIVAQASKKRKYEEDVYVNEYG